MPQTTLGTVASVLPLEVTDILAAAPFFGEVREGPELGAVHRWPAWDEGALHIVAWHEFRSADDIDVGSGVELTTGSPVRLWRLSRREQTLSSTLIEGRHRGARVSEPLVQRATLVAAPPHGTATAFALACLPDDAVCLREDLTRPIESLARSLQPGALLGGRTWVVRVPDGPTRDASLTLTLPEDLVGLPLRGASAGRWHALLVSLRTGSIVLRLVIRHWPEARGAATERSFACAPYECAWQPSPAFAEEAGPLIAQVRRDRVPAEEAVSLIDDRIGLVAGGPTEHHAADATWGVGRTAVHRTLVRVAVSSTTAAAAEISASDSLQPIEWPLRWPIDVGFHTLREGQVDELPSSDAAWSVFAARDAPDDQVHLFVLEHAGTALELRVQFDEPLGDEARASAARAIAAGLRRLGPTRTTDRWDVVLGSLALHVSLPARFATTYDEALDEGWSAATAVYLGQPRSEIVFTRGDRPPARRPIARRTISIGGLEVELGTYRRGAAEPWTAAVPCGCQLRCTVEVRGDDAQREALIAALATARLEHRSGTLEDVHVRSGPSDDADAVGRIWPSREVSVLQTRGEWVEIDGRDSPSGARTRGWLPARTLGEHCD